MEESKKVTFTALVIIAVVVVAICIYFFLIRGKSKESTEIPEITEKTTAVIPSEEAVKGEEKMPDYIDVTLGKSDDLIRKLIGEFSSSVELKGWLTTDDIIRKFVAAVDNIANGQSPKAHIDFFNPEGKFKVIKRNDKYYVDPIGYKRYAIVAEVFSSLDSESCVRRYRQLKPVIQEAYSDLGYPDADFQDTLVMAIRELLEVPVIKKDILLEKKVISFVIAEAELEKMSQAQKHFFRMGPENISNIQAKLREMASDLGIPESKLPRS